MFFGGEGQGPRGAQGGLGEVKMKKKTHEKWKIKNNTGCFVG